MLPPKRELPFPAKKDRPKAPQLELDRAALSSSRDPLRREITPPKPTKQRKSRAKATKPKTVISSPASGGKAKTAEPEYRAESPTAFTVPARTESSNKPVTSNAAVPTSDTLIAPVSPSHSNDELSTVPPKAAKKPPKKFLENAKASLHPPKNFEDIAPDAFMDQLDHWVRKYKDLPVPTQPKTAAEHLAAYTAQSEETRLAVIDDMIVECLGDDNFIKLVEDIDKSWKRIGLGF